MQKGIRLIKRMVALSLVLLLSIESFAAVVSDNDGSAFITKAEFDSLKNDFQNQINQYNTSIDSKIDGAIASYLSGIHIEKETLIDPLMSMSGYQFVSYPVPVADDYGMWGQNNTWKKDGSFNLVPSGYRISFTSLGTGGGGTAGSQIYLGGFIIKRCEERWGTTSTIMESVYDEEEQKALYSSAFYLIVDDINSDKKYLKKINFAKAKLKQKKWPSGNFFIAPTSDSAELMVANAVSWWHAWYDNMRVQVKHPNVITDNSVYDFITTRHAKSRGSTSTSWTVYDVSTTGSSPVSQIMEVTEKYSYINKTIGFLTNNPTDFSLCFALENGFPAMIQENKDVSYAVTSYEGNSTQQCGLETEYADYTVGKKVTFNIGVQKFDTSKVSSFSSLYNYSINSDLNFDVHFNEGIPFLTSTTNGTATMKVKGTKSSTGKFLIKGDKFSGWTYNDYLSSSQQVTLSNGSAATQTPALDAVETWNFPVETGKTYYFKADVGAGIEIIDQIKIVSD